MKRNTISAATSMRSSTIAVAAIAVAVVAVALVAVAGTTESAPANANPFQIVEIGEMSVARAAHQATVLGNGRVLITGGCDDPGCENVLASAEVYDPAAGSFRTVDPMATPRDAHAAAALPDGRVLVAGGWTGRRATATAEVYDPATGRFVAVDDMAEARSDVVAAPLPGGRVLLVGGTTSGVTPLASAEIFDPATSTFSATGRTNVPRTAHIAIPLADGRVLVTGGRSSRRGPALRSAEIFDPVAGAFQPTGDMTVPRQKHAAALLPDGRVLIIGGSDARDARGRGRYSSTEVYDPATGEFSPGPSMQGARFKIRDAVAVLPSGIVLVAGGAPRPEVHLATEGIFVPVQGELIGPRMFATATLLPTGEAVILGGYDGRIRPSASAWLFHVER